MSTCGSTKLCVPVKLIADTAQDGPKQQFKTDILMTKLDLNQQLPLEVDIKMIRHHAIDIMRKYEADAFQMWDIHSFVELRDCACTRLTLFNGRRGREPARLRLQE